MFITSFPGILFTVALIVLIPVAIIQAICTLCRRQAAEAAHSTEVSASPVIPSVGGGVGGVGGSSEFSSRNKEPIVELRDHKIQVLVVNPTGSLSLGVNEPV